jgi:hypothetical protein
VISIKAVLNDPKLNISQNLGTQESQTLSRYSAMSAFETKQEKFPTPEPFRYLKKSTDGLSWKRVSLEDSGIDGVLPVSGGGTGLSSVDSGYAQKGAGTSAVTPFLTRQVTSATKLTAENSLANQNTFYYGTPYFNGSKSYNSSNSIYAPTSYGSAGQILKSDSPPTWSSVTFTTNSSITYVSGWSGALTHRVLSDGATWIKFISGYFKNSSKISTNSIHSVASGFAVPGSLIYFPVVFEMKGASDVIAFYGGVGMGRLTAEGVLEFSVYTVDGGYYPANAYIYLNIAYY